MQTKAKPRQTETDIQNAINGYDCLHEAIYVTKAYDDLSKVNFDMENLEEFGTEGSYNHLPGLEDLEGYETLGEGDSSFTVLWCAAGGDWELPLVFVLYIGDDGELHGYVPEEGNAYNHEKMSAYGNNDGDPQWDEDDPRYVFDVDKMRQEIANKIG